MNNDRFKFRIFDKETGKYYKTRISKGSGCVVYQHPSDSHCQWVQISTMFAELEQDEKTYLNTGLEPDFIIEQCTGLKDKNGNLIYEGDLIKSPNNSYPLEIVRMPNGVYGCRVCKTNGVWEMNLYDLIRNYGVEIIGNIHEQKEVK